MNSSLTQILLIIVAVGALGWTAGNTQGYSDGIERGHQIWQKTDQSIGRSLGYQRCQDNIRCAKLKYKETLTDSEKVEYATCLKEESK